MKCKTLKLKVKFFYNEFEHSYSISNDGFNCPDFTHSVDVDVCNSDFSSYFIIKKLKSRSSSTLPTFIPIPITLDFGYSPSVVDRSLILLNFKPYASYIHDLLRLIHSYISTL